MTKEKNVVFKWLAKATCSLKLNLQAQYSVVFSIVENSDADKKKYVKSISVLLNRATSLRQTGTSGVGRIATKVWHCLHPKLVWREYSQSVVYSPVNEKTNAKITIASRI
jgi:hypothetical protein